MIAITTLRRGPTMAFADQNWAFEFVNATQSGTTSAKAEMLNWLSCGVLITDCDARIVFANRRAQELVQARLLSVQNDQLRGQVSHETNDMHRLISECTADSASRCEPIGMACCRLGALLLQIVPLRAEDAFEDRGRLVGIFVTDAEKIGDPSPAELRMRFGLTNAEAQVAREIAKGAGVKQCAKALGTSEATARSHLHKIFEKTGCRRQAQLVRVILSARSPIRGR